MGILKNLFGGKNNVPEKSGEMMEENKFWDIVEASLKDTEGQDEQEEYFIKTLAKLPPKEIIGFRLRTDQLLYDTYTPTMWCAGYILNGGCSDDGFEYFRCWVISRGKEVYYAAKENPDSLISEMDEEMDEYDFESFWHVALEAFGQATGKSLYDYVDYDVFKMGEGNYPPIEFNWKEEDPESMRRLCPRLFEANPIE